MDVCVDVSRLLIGRARGQTRGGECPICELSEVLPLLGLGHSLLDRELEASLGRRLVERVLERPSDAHVALLVQGGTAS